MVQLFILQKRCQIVCWLSLGAKIRRNDEIKEKSLFFFIYLMKPRHILDICWRLFFVYLILIYLSRCICCQETDDRQTKYGFCLSKTWRIGFSLFQNHLFSRQSLDVCQETRKSFIFREKFPCKIWLVGDECVPLHPLLGLAPRRASRRSVLWKIYIEDK